jgi:O-Antigen ligase
VREVRISITNTGRLMWDSADNPPVYVSYHWLEPTADRVVVFEGLRTPFPAAVSPDDTVTLLARVRAPRQPGTYRLAWDVVQEGRLWFSTEPGGTLTFSRATVTGAFAGGPLTTYPLPRRAVRPGRLTLWRAAGRMLVAHPLLGVGPDGFRLLYGEYAGIPNADVRIHSNNMYFEVIVGAGIAGAVAFAWLLWRVVRNVAADLRAAWLPGLAAATGVAAALIAVGVHGLVDSFFGFTPTYVLIALTLGLAEASANAASKETHADRI